MTTDAPRLARITVYPIKSMDGCTLAQTAVLPGGALETPFHGLGELRERRLVEPGARLVGVRVHLGDRQLAQRARRLGLLPGDRTQQGFESTTQPLGLGHVVTSGSGSGDVSIDAGDSRRRTRSWATEI